MKRKYNTKEHNTTFINFKWPRIEKVDIIIIKVIRTASNKSNLLYIILQSWDGHLSVDQVLILFLKIDVSTSLIESGTSSHIFWAKDKTFASIMDWEISPFKNWRISKIVVFIGKLQRIYNLRRDLVFSLTNFGCRGL